MQFHPDVNKDVDAVDKFKSIRHAYEVSTTILHSHCFTTLWSQIISQIVKLLAMYIDKL